MNDHKREIVNQLFRAVGEFNKDLQAWERKTGCKANFRWGYIGDDKILEVSDITLSVYRADMTAVELNEVLRKVTESAEPISVKPQ